MDDETASYVRREISRDSVVELKRWITRGNVNEDCGISMFLTTPAEYAASRGSLDCLHWLLTEMKAEPRSCLHRAAEKNMPQVVECLLRSGVNVNGRIRECTPISYGHDFPQIVSLLLRHGANPDALCADNPNSMLDQAVVHACQKKSSVDDPWTPFLGLNHESIATGKLIATMLIEAGADTGTVKHRGNDAVPALLAELKNNMITKRKHCAAAMAALLFCLRRRRAPHDLVRHWLIQYVGSTWKDVRWLMQ